MPNSPKMPLKTIPTTHVVTLVFPSDRIGGIIKVDGQEAKIREDNGTIVKIEVAQKDESQSFTLHKEGKATCTKNRLIRKNEEIILCQQ